MQRKMRRFIIGTLGLVPVLAAGHVVASTGHGSPAAPYGHEVHAEARGGEFVREDSGRVVVVRSVGAELTFEPAVITAAAGETLTIRYENVGEMIHNIVVVKSVEDIPIIGEASLQAAYTNKWIPTGADHVNRIIAHTALAGPGEVVEVTFTVPPPGEYPFICTYASHWSMMQGQLIVTD
jgi:plastocyanin